MAQSYKEVLTDPRWQKKRLEIFDRDKWACRYCDDTTKTLHLHHLFYLADKPPWDYPDYAFLTLCCDCHKDEENLKSEDSVLLASFSMSNLNRRQLYALALELRRHLSQEGIPNIRFQQLMEYLHG